MGETRSLNHWITARLTGDATFVVMGQGQLTAKRLDNMIALLTAQREVIVDEIATNSPEGE